MRSKESSPMNSARATFLIDRWQILFHQTMAALLRAKEAVKQKLGFWGVLSGLWKCSRDLKEMNAALKMLSEAPDGYLSEEIIKTQISQSRQLLTSIEGLLDGAKRANIMNRRLAASPLESIRSSGQFIADYLESLEMSIDPAVLDSISEGRSQFEHGEFEVMERLF